MTRILVAGSWLFAVAVVIPADAQTLKQLPEGVALGDEHAVAKGATLLSSYETHQPSVDQVGQVRAENRATVNRFFQLPIGPERAGLYAADGVKQIPHMGIQWQGAGAQLKNNEQNQTLFPGWSWKNVVIWDTQDPTVFFVEADGSTAPGATPSSANHYVMQVVAKSGRIDLFREFLVPLKLTR
jgi:hypothetical protein